MITSEIIQRVQSLYSKGVQSDDSRLSNRHIYNKLISVRARLITQQAKQKQRLSQWNYQLLPCIELEVAPIHECPCIPYEGCKILRSKYPIPKVLTDMNRHLIQSVTKIDGSYEFPETTWEDIQNKKGNRFTSKLPEFFIRNGYLYITSNTNLEVITLSALFGDPSEAELFPKYCEDDTVDCVSPLDKEFPGDMDFVESLVRLSSDELILMFSQMAEDKQNNTADDSSPIKLPRRSDKYIQE